MSLTYLKTRSQNKTSIVSSERTKKQINPCLGTVVIICPQSSYCTFLQEKSKYNLDQTMTKISFFCFFVLTSLLEYNCFTVVCQFLLYNKVNQLYLYICPHISSLFHLPPSHPIPPLQVVTKQRADLPVLCGYFPLAIYFTFGSVYMSMPLSHFVPAYPSPSLYPQVYSLVGLHLYSHLAPGSSDHFFFFLFFRFHIYVLAYCICFSLSDLLHSV